MFASHFWALIAAEYLTNIADNSGAHGLHGLPNSIIRMSLVSHLRDHFVAVLGLHQRPALPNIVSKGLLGVNVNSSLHGCHGRRKVRVIWRGDDHRIDFLVHLVQHDAEVVEERLIRLPTLQVLRTQIPIHITEGNEVLIRASLLVRLLRNPASRADESDVQLSIGRFTGLADGEAWKCSAGSSDRGGLDEDAAFHDL